MTDELNLAEFARWAIENGSWDGSLGLDGGDIQEKAVSCGILIKTKYDPEIHGNNDVDCEPGDNWYVYSPAFAAARRAKIRALEPKP